MMKNMANRYGIRRGKQSEYNKLLDDFSGKSKTKKDCVEYLIAQGFTPAQAQNAVHVYWKGGETKANFLLSGEHRDQLLDNFDATQKTNKQCVNYLTSYGCTYRQATSAVYKYRQEKGLIGKYRES